MRRLSIAFGCGTAAAVLVIVAINTYLPSQLGRMGMPATLIAFVLSWDNYLAFLSIGLIGALSDRIWTPIGRRKPLLIGAALMAATLLLIIPRIGSIELLMGLLVLLNLCVACMSLGSHALLADRVPQGLQTLVNGAGKTTVSLVVIGGYLGSGAAAGALGLAGAFAVIAALAVSMALITLSIREERGVLVEASGKLRGTMPLWGLMRRDRETLWSLGAIFWMLAALGAAEAWVPDFAQRGLGLPAAQAAPLLVIPTVVLVITAVPVGWLARRVGPRPVLRTGALVLCCCYLGGAALVQDRATLMLFQVVNGLGVALITTTALPMALRLIPGSQEHGGAATGMFLVLLNLAYAVGPQLGGVMLDLTGTHTNILRLCAVFAILSSVAWIFARRSGRSLPSLPQPV